MQANKQLIVKIENDPFINRRLVYRKTSFEKESADLLSLTDKPLNLTTFHKNISKKKGRGEGLAR